MPPLVCKILWSFKRQCTVPEQFFYKISSSKSSNIIVLVLAQIMGMYFCSSVLLMRMNMPSEYRVIITEVLGGLHFNFYHRWFDVIFLVSAITTIVVLYLLHKPPHSDTMDNWKTCELMAVSPLIDRISLQCVLLSPLFTKWVFCYSFHFVSLVMTFNVNKLLIKTTLSALGFLLKFDKKKGIECLFPCYSL